MGVLLPVTLPPILDTAIECAYAHANLRSASKPAAKNACRHYALVVGVSPAAGNETESGCQFRINNPAGKHSYLHEYEKVGTEYLLAECRALNVWILIYDRPKK